jgi:hypothetical protein
VVLMPTKIDAVWNQILTFRPGDHGAPTIGARAHD